MAGLQSIYNEIATLILNAASKKPVPTNYPSVKLGAWINEVFLVKVPNDPARYYITFKNGSFTQALHYGRVQPVGGVAVDINEITVNNYEILHVTAGRSTGTTIANPSVNVGEHQNILVVQGDDLDPLSIKTDESPGLNIGGEEGIATRVMGDDTLFIGMAISHLPETAGYDVDDTYLVIWNTTYDRHEKVLIDGLPSPSATTRWEPLVYDGDIVFFDGDIAMVEVDI